MPACLAVAAATRRSFALSIAVLVVLALGSAGAQAAGPRPAAKQDAAVIVLRQAGVAAMSLQSSCRERRSCDTTAPSVPTGVAVVAPSRSSLTLAWAAATDNVAVRGYEVYRGGSRRGSTSSLSYRFSSLSCGSVYTLGVRAYDAAGNRSALASITARTTPCSSPTPPPPAPLAPPTALTAGAFSETAVQLSWTPSSDLRVTSYEAGREGATATRTTTSSTQIGGLACGTSYRFEVRALDSAGVRSVAVSATGSTSACAPPPPPPPPPPPAPATGLPHPSSAALGFSNGGVMQYDTEAILIRCLDDEQAMGGKWLRTDFTWSNIQNGGPASWDFARYENLVRKADARGIKVIAALGYTPTWARPAGATSDKWAPAVDATFATYVYETVKRFSPLGVKHYEIWNEANSPDFLIVPAGQDKMAKYTAMLKAAYAAAKRADPNVVVISAGLAPAGGYYWTPPVGTVNPVRFLEGMYANGAAGHFDALGHHPYSFPGRPSSTHAHSAWQQMQGDPSHGFQVWDGAVAKWAPSLRSLMIANGDAAKKIYATEYGVPSANYSGASEPAQADHIKEAVELWRSYPWASVMAVYLQRDFQNGGSATHFFPYYGVLRSDWTRKPAWHTLHALASV